jgi:hypothetical protein
LVRDLVVAVRLTGVEFVEWSAAATRSPFGSVARWCREVVNDGVVFFPEGARPWVPVRVPPELVGPITDVCARLNQSAMRSHRFGVLAADVRPVLDELAEAARVTGQTFQGRPGHVVPRRVPRKHLVSVRVSPDELEAWTRHAEVDGFGRVSSWVRGLTGSAVGLRVSATRFTVPEPVKIARRQFAGAMTNLSQLQTLAEASGDDALVVRIEQARAVVQRALLELHEAR